MYFKMPSLKKYFYYAAVVMMVCASSALAQTASPNLVNNAGFEESTSHWQLPSAAKITSDQTHSGKNSLQYTNTNAEEYHFISQTLDVHPGQQLSFSAWIKGKNLINEKNSQGAGIFLQSYDATDKFIRGSYPQTFSGTFDWKRTQGIYIVPENAAKTVVCLYFRRGVTGRAWFDGVAVRVETPPAFYSTLRFPNYRGIVKKGDTQPWKVQVELRNVNAKNIPVHIMHVLRDSAGKVLWNTSTKVTTAHQEVEITLPDSSNLSQGTYTLKETVTSSTDEMLAAKEYILEVVQEMPKVYIDAEGFTVVEGKRFFPLGVYLGPIETTSNEHLQRISNAGFNTILCYRYGTAENPEAYLDRAAQNDLKVLFAINNLYPGLNNAPANGFEIATGYIKALRDKPALLGWYTSDERPAAWLPQLKKMYELVKQNSPDLPAFVLLNQVNHNSLIEKYLDVTDVLGTDYYPVGEADLSKTSLYARNTKRVTTNTHGMWMVPQIMDWAVYRKDSKPHPPSLNEMRNQAYQAIINGATGLLFYSYYDMLYEKYPRNKSTINMALFHKRWPDVAAMAREIKTLSPAILAGKKISLSAPPNSLLEISALEYQDQLLILLANPYYEQNTVTIQLPKGWAVKHVEQGQIKSTFNQGQITFTLPPVGSGVFRLERS